MLSTMRKTRRSTTRSRGYAFMYGNADDWDVIRDSHEKSMREAMSKILAARTDPEHPNSLHQEYERI